MPEKHMASTRRIRLRVATLLLSSLSVPAAAVQSTPPPYEPDANAPRARVPSQYKWDLAPLFADDQRLEKALSEIAKRSARFARYQGRLEHPRVLAECLDLYFDTRLLANKATLYASMRLDSDVKSPTLQVYNDRSLQAYEDFMAASAFVRQAILRLGDTEIGQLLRSEPRLRPFAPYFQQLRRRRDHLLDPHAERILAMAGDNLWAEIDLNELPSDFEKIFAALITEVELPVIEDEEGNPVQLTLSNFARYRASPSRLVRRTAVEGLFNALRGHENSLAAALHGQFRFNVFLAQARDYDTALGAYLEKDRVDTQVYRNLITTVRANLAPLREYLRLRQELMGLKELHIYDLYAPVVEPATAVYSYAQAQQILPEALAPLGREYVKTLIRGLDPANGWIDLYPHRNKRSGAFCASVYGVHPYVKMNYFQGLNDLSTLAHEYGHALHSHLSMTHQPYVTFNYPPMLAETASTTNEVLLAQHLLKHSNEPAEKLFVLNQIAETLRTTVYRQAIFAEFELLGHQAVEEGVPLNAEFLNSTYARLLREYYGEQLTLEPNDALEWAYVPHFYYKYYVYSYAVGLSAGVALAERLQAGDAKAREAYVRVLKAGSSQPPAALLLQAGVDPRQPNTIAAAARLMQDTLVQMKDLLRSERTIRLARDEAWSGKDTKELIKTDAHEEKAATAAE